MERFWDKVDRAGPDECWEWTGGITSGYGMFWLVDKNCRAHRVSWELTYGEIPEGLYVLHRCDNKPCVNPAHLFLGTHSDNMKDMYSKGLGDDKRGEACHASKLTENDVKVIRSSTDDMTHAEVAAVYGVDPSQISRVLNNKTWRV